MRFSPDEVQLARQLKTLGLPWDPQPGNYVWDEDWLIDCPTPFHDRVYFILDLKHFLRRAGTIEALKEALIWLPTWHDARVILATLGISHELVADRLNDSKAISKDCERAVLYQMIYDELLLKKTSSANSLKAGMRETLSHPADLATASQNTDKRF